MVLSWPLMAAYLPAVILAAGPTTAPDPTVTLESLLAEMADRQALARLPDPAYKCLQASSYDRRQTDPKNPSTWHANKDSGHFLRIEEKAGRKEWVIMEDDGPGCVTHIWIPLLPDRAAQVARFYLDGAAEPAIEAGWNDLVSGKAFVKPPFAFVAAHPVDLKTNRVGGDLYLPVPYARGCKITLDQPPFYYIINYRRYEDGTSVEPFTMERYQQAASALRRTAAALRETKPRMAGLERFGLARTLKPKGRAEIELPAGPAAVMALRLQLGGDVAPALLRSTVLQIEFDDETTVWCPAGEFFGCGVRLRPVSDFFRTVGKDGEMSSRWCMPYKKSGRITVWNLSAKPLQVQIEAGVGEWEWDEASMHFHASWRHEHPIATRPFKDWNYVTITGAGRYVGDTLTVFNPDPGWYGEGDERIYVDGEAFPSHLGTGTEDYYGYAWGMAYAFSSPFIAMPQRDGSGKGNWRGYTATSRVRALDSIPFGRSLRMDMEVWHSRATQVAYTAAAFWYARPGARSNRGADPESAAADLPDVPAPPKAGR